MSDRPRPDGLLQDWHRYSDAAPGWKTVIGGLIFNAGLLTVFLFRLAQRRRARGSQILSRLVHRLNMLQSGCELHPEAVVEPGLFLPHPYGVTIGRGCRVGQDATLYQGVVLGARTSLGLDGTETSAYPRVGDRAVLYPHALVYGDVTLGQGAVVLGNSVVAQDVAAGAVVGGVPAKPIRAKSKQVEIDAG